MSYDHTTATIAARYSHRTANFGKALAIGVSLSLAFVIVQVVFGVRANIVGPERRKAEAIVDRPRENYLLGWSLSGH